MAWRSTVCVKIVDFICAMTEVSKRGRAASYIALPIVCFQLLSVLKKKITSYSYLHTLKVNKDFAVSTQFNFFYI